jgi:hypothetical protein
MSPKRHTLRVGDKVHEVVVHEIVEIDPTSPVEAEPLPWPDGHSYIGNPG